MLTQKIVPHHTASVIEIPTAKNFDDVQREEKFAGTVRLQRFYCPTEICGSGLTPSTGPWWKVGWFGFDLAEVSVGRHLWFIRVKG